MHDALRDRVLAVAGRLLQDEGAEALTNRRIAALADTTTMAIYSRFGGKGGVLDALYAEGVHVLALAQQAVGEEPDEVRALCRAFRATALAHAGHYGLLFGAPIAGWAPREDQRLRLLGAFARLQDACARSTGEDGPRLAWALFVACHGHVALELGGYVVPGVDPEAAFEDVLARLLDAPAGVPPGGCASTPPG